MMKTQKTLKLIGVMVATPLMLNSCATSSAPAELAGAKPYPLQTCIVTDNQLGSMGDPIVKVYNGQQVKFCCAPCVVKFERNPAKYLAKLP